MGERGTGGAWSPGPPPLPTARAGDEIGKARFPVARGGDKALLCRIASLFLTYAESINYRINILIDTCDTHQNDFQPYYRQTVYILVIVLDLDHMELLATIQVLPVRPCSPSVMWVCLIWPLQPSSPAVGGP